MFQSSATVFKPQKWPSTTDASSQPSFSIGKIPIDGRLILAPMDGFSDLPFRSLCRDYGSAVSYTDFVNCIDLLNDVPQAWRKLHYQEQERPLVFQIFDADEARLLQAAQRIEKLNPDWIDINMGCSVRCVSGRGAGAGLLRDPEKVGRIIASLNQHLAVPVSAKIRLGWDDQDLNYLQISQAVEENGGVCIAVHGRTRAQKYGGHANWDAIGEIKAQVAIPVIGNGDVRTPQDAQRMLSYTGCDAIMIGRGAMGNPWIFQGRSQSDVGLDERMQVIGLHLARMQEHYGPKRGLVLFRKHLSRYLAPIELSDAQRRLALTREHAVDLSLALQSAGLPALSLTYERQVET